MNLSAHIVRDGNDSDEPDFFVKLDGNEVGFELTQLFKSISGNGSADKECEMYHHKFLSRLADTYYQMSDIPIQLQFNGTISKCTEDNLHDLAQRISEATKQLDEWGDSEIELEGGDSFHIHRLSNSLKGYRRWTWVNGHIGWPCTINQALLQAKIKPKHDRLERYKRSVDRVRLLVFSDRTWNSGMLLLDNPLPTVELRGFEKIYLYLHPEQAFQIGI